MVAIRLNNVSASYFIRASSRSSASKKQTVGAEIAKKGGFLEIRALQDILFSVVPGERIGLVGINGSGKSTLLKVLAKSLSIQSGEMEIEGSICPQFSLASGMRPTLSGRSNTTLKCLYHGVSLRNIPKKVEEMKQLSQLGEYFELPMRTYSSGMRSRLAMSLLSLLSGDIVVMDEWISTADASVSEIVNNLQTKIIDSASILVTASHSEKVLKSWTNRIIWLDRGKILADGPIDDVFKDYQQFIRKRS